MNEIEKAERIQAWKAFLIPSGLFVACLCNAAGIFMIHSGSSIGVVFLGIGFLIIVAGFGACITFQNKKRAQGEWKRLPGDTPAGAQHPEASGDEDDRISPEEIVAQLREEARV